MEEVETINKYGGHLEAAIGIPEGGKSYAFAV